jgi:hypothetical protein
VLLPVIDPPVQFSEPVTLRLPAPPNTPARLRTFDVDAEPTVSEPELVMVSDPLFESATIVVADDNVTDAPLGMTAVSFVPGA